MPTHTRTETDSFGPIEVPGDSYWGAQTERSVANFPFGERERMPAEIVHALGYVKQAAARVNARLGGLDPELAEAIQQAAGEVARGDLDGQFPLVIWQTGSGTQSNMNANEVIAGRANEKLTGNRGGIRSFSVTSFFFSNTMRSLAGCVLTVTGTLRTIGRSSLSVM